jgi:hypothetical protein
MPVTIVGNNTPTAGGVVYGDGTNYASTAAGTSGQVLTSAGSGAPNWATPSAGAMTFISSATASSSASVAFTGLSNTYAYYIVEYDGVRPATAGTNMQLQVSTDGGSTYLTTAIYNYNVLASDSSSASVQNSRSVGQASIYVLFSPISGLSNNASYTCAGQVEFYGAGNAVTFAVSSKGFVPSDNAGNQVMSYGGGYSTSTLTVNAIRFSMVSGNIAAGNFRLYGVAKA